MIIKARAVFYGKENGGRLTPPVSGYKPHLRVGSEFTSCVIMLKEGRANKRCQPHFEKNPTLKSLFITKNLIETSKKEKTDR